MKIYTLWILFVSVVLLGGGCMTMTAQTISIADRTAKRGDIITVDIQANQLVSSPVGSITLVLQYSYKLLYVKGVIGGEQRMMQCNPPAFQTEPPNPPSRGVLTITCNSISTNPQEVLASIQFEVLAGDTTAALITPLALMVDQVTMSSVTFRPGTITISDPPVKPQPKETLSQNFPNPCAGITTFNYTLSGTTPVSFSVFSMAGQLVWRHSAGEQTEGSYTLKFDPGSETDFQMANGSYLFQMTTQNGVYFIPFFYLR